MKTSEIKAGLEVIKAIAEAIREAKSIPSGTLYAVLMGKLSLEQYEKIISILINAGLVTESGHVLTWADNGGTK